jgi:hypothetical protein
MRTIAFVFLLAAALAGGCGGDDSPIVEVPQPLLSDIQEKVFTPSCAAFSSCHATNGPAKCDLTSSRSFATLVGRSAVVNPSRTLVVPGDPEGSFLVAKLRGHLETADGDPMPLRNPPLPEEVIQAIEQWIAEGAQNN